MRAFALIALLALAAGLAPAAGPVTPEADRRGEDQTFLTYPEWFLVYSPDEYADFLADDRPPSEFPYLGHLRQFWQAYRALAERTSQSYPFNGEYHTMIGVIGVSTSVEYGIKAAYELMVGRLTEATRGPRPTAEDLLSAEVARDYVAFLDRQPWYEYDYGARLRQLWTDTPWTGPDLLRKWERRYFLTSEFAAKALYAKLIGWGAASSFDKPKPETVALVSGLPDGAPLPADVRLVERRADGLLLALPRYQPFTAASLSLAKRGGRFIEIAGNREAILVTALAPSDWTPPAGWPHELLFRQPVLTRPAQHRIAVAVPVAELSPLVERLATEPLALEHVYDY